jgi:hypothetical protein
MLPLAEARQHTASGQGWYLSASEERKLLPRLHFALCVMSPKKGETWLRAAYNRPTNRKPSR